VKVVEKVSVGAMLTAGGRLKQVSSRSRMERVMGGSDDRADGGGLFPNNRIRIEIGEGNGTNRVTFAQSRLHFLLLS
jgi:hypothetical protein